MRIANISILKLEAVTKHLNAVCRDKLSSFFSAWRNDTTINMFLSTKIPSYLIKLSEFPIYDIRI